MSNDDEQRDERDEAIAAAWTAQTPPRGFTERVVARALAREQAARRRARWAAAATVGLGVAAAATLVVTAPWRPARGDIVAAARRQVAIGRRATAVLEPGARVAWRGDQVEQLRGSVFYRVEPGSSFRVHTPAGDVAVRGTCFSVALDERAAMGVRVYEGRVEVARGGQRVELAAGEAGEVSAEGDVRRAEPSPRDPGAEPGAPAAASGGAAAAADLEAELRACRDELAAADEHRAQAAGDEAPALASSASSAPASGARDGGAPAGVDHRFDPTTPEHWAALARQGAVAYRLPCAMPRTWRASPAALDRASLAPQDETVLREAYTHSAQRVWAELGPICAAAIGGHPDVVGRIARAVRGGRMVCVQLVLDAARERDARAAADAIRRVAEVRAGLRPAPAGDAAALHPVERMFLMLTGEAQRFEDELAQSLGPDTARRLVHDEPLDPRGVCVFSDAYWGAALLPRPASGTSPADAGTPPPPPH